jgi:hypothetical protein
VRGEGDASSWTCRIKRDGESANAWQRDPRFVGIWEGPAVWDGRCRKGSVIQGDDIHASSEKLGFSWRTATAGEGQNGICEKRRFPQFRDGGRGFREGRGGEGRGREGKGGERRPGGGVLPGEVRVGEKRVSRGFSGSGSWRGGKRAWRGRKSASGGARRASGVGGRAWGSSWPEAPASLRVRGEAPEADEWKCPERRSAMRGEAP